MIDFEKDQEETKKLYHKLVKKGVINKDIQMKEVKKTVSYTHLTLPTIYSV